MLNYVTIDACNYFSYLLYHKTDNYHGGRIDKEIDVGCNYHGGRIDKEIDVGYNYYGGRIDEECTLCIQLMLSFVYENLIKNATENIKVNQGIVS